MKTKLLLVSDDPSLRVEVIKLIQEYFPEIEFTSSSCKSDAIKNLETKKFPILLVDFCSKGFDAIDIITASKEKSPVTFRISIYDALKKEKALYSSAEVHRFLQKPIKQDEFKKALSHFIRLQSIQLDANIITAINELGATPILPDIYLRLEREMNRDEISVHRIADIISDDPTVAAKILHIIYASFYNVSKGVVNLIHAIHFLGLDIIKHLVLYVKVFTVKNLSLEAQSQLKHLRDHSILVAKVSKAIMNMEVKDRELIDAAYIAGLLHDIGKILLIQFEDKPKRTNGNGTNGKYVHQISNNQSVISHIEVGAYLLSLWNFPSELIDAVSNHHSAEIVNAEDFSLNQVVFIANALVNSNTEALKKIEVAHGKQKLIEWTEVIPSKLDVA
jgi:putative nucleotidyltransferase with HDIG domain